MIVKRVTVLVTGTVLAASGAAVAAHAALASDDGPGQPPAANGPAATPQTITRTVPGFGTVMFTVDPGTGAISNVVVMPLTGITAGTPVVRDGKILVPVTRADGTTETLRVDVEAEDGQVRVEAELENENDNESAPEPPTTEPAEHEEAPQAEQRQAPDAEHGEGETPSVGATRVTPHQDVGPPAPSGAEDGGGQHRGGEDGAGQHGGAND